MDYMNRLVVIILNWNGADDTIACIDSLRQQKTVPSIIVVDNDSSDDSLARLQQYKKRHSKSDLRLIKNTQNSGFAGGINVGLLHALGEGFEYIGILNPDATAAKMWSTELIKELDKNPEYGLVTGLLLSRDGKTIDSTGDFYSMWGLAFPRGRGQPRSQASKKAEPVFGATGGSVVFRASVFEKIGLFDERFFMYYEDVDISFRAQLAGFRVRYTPRAIAYHKQGASSQKVPGLTVYNTFKNLPLLAYKNLPTGLLWSVLPRFWLAYWLFYFNAIRRGNGWAATKGIGASLRLLPYCIAYRHKNRRARIVTVKYIRSLIYDGLPPVESGLQRLIHPFKSRRSKA